LSIVRQKIKGKPKYIKHHSYNYPGIRMRYESPVAGEL